MKDSNNYKLRTRLQHLGTALLDEHNPMAPVALPPMRTSTVRFNTLDDLDRTNRAKAKGERVVSYGRMGMDTNHELEKVFCALENGERAFLASSGVGAIAMVLMALLSQGEHMVCSDNVYGPVRELQDIVLSRMGIEADFCDGTDLEAIEKAIRPETRVLYVESPGSLLMQMLDMPALAEIARKHNLVLIADNTWGSGLIYRPLDLGADITVVAGTKYVGGHSDLMLGAVVVKGEELTKRIMASQYAMGYSVSPDDAWLAIRGVRTLPVRMAQHAKNALEICEFFASLPQTKKIYHPAYEKDDGHALWKRDAHGSNGLISLELEITEQQARQFVDSLELFGIGYSWGGYENLVQLVHPGGIRDHSYWNGSRNQLIRLHVGLEEVEDTIADLRQAWEQAVGQRD